MRRTITYVAVWFAAGIGAVTLGSAAVSLVGNQVTGSRPAPLSADEVRSELSGDAGSTTTTTSDGSATSTAPAGGTTVTTRPGSTPTTSAPSGTNGTTPTAATQPTPPPETRTYPLEGGTVTMRFEATGVTVLEATPRPGYSVEVEPTHGNGSQVEFRSDDHRSRVEGWWDDGPRDEVREEED